MNIVVLNGSPKGEHSITLAYLHYVQTCFPEYRYSVIHVAKDIQTIERSPDRFDRITNRIRAADALVWLYGVWVLLVPAQMVRFLELIRERNQRHVFAGKYSASMSTSIHYLDHFAEHYIRAESEDLGMQFFDHLSLDIRDLMNAEKRGNIRRFFSYFVASANRRQPLPKHTATLTLPQFRYRPQPAAPPPDVKGKRVLILSDSQRNGSNLHHMTQRFAARCGTNARVVTIAELGLQGGCVGCMRCGRDNSCIYRDGFEQFYNETVMSADVIIFAVTIAGRFVSSEFKTFLDRAYFWTHTPSLAGTTIGYLVEGSLCEHLNTRQFLEATVTARQHALFAGIVTDECADTTTLNALIDDFAATCLQYTSDRYAKGFNFLMHGAHKVFRDYNWAGIRLIWQADHRFYRKHRLYDFPQRNWLKNLLLSLLMVLTRIPAVKRSIDTNIRTMPASRLRKFIDTRLVNRRSA